MAGESAPLPKSQSAFGERYSVNFSVPLPQFDTSGGKAYKVVDSKKPDAPLYAFVHYHGAYVRSNVYKLLSKRSSPNVVCPVDHGLMNIQAGENRQSLVTIFERPTGDPLFSVEGAHPKLDTSKLRTNVALSIIKAIAGLHKKKIIHGSLHPSRMFFVSQESDDVYLGECITTPCGFDQPPEYEPLSVAFADAEGRGEGTPSRDFFQLGASIMTLYFGKSLDGARAQEAMLMARVNQSSFWALAGGQDVPGAVGQLLKGVMLDDDEDRWGFEDVLNWYEGSAPIKRSGMRNWTMNRPTNFKGTSYVDRRLLASAFAHDPKSAAVLIRGLEFEQWMSMCLREEIYSDSLQSLLAISSGSGMGHEEAHALITRFTVFLHPDGPIRYKGLSFYPDAVPALMQTLVQRDEREKIRFLLEIMNKKLMTALASLSNEQNPNGAKLLNQYSGYDGYARSPDVGKGVERVLYELNPAAPCMSPKMDKNWVVSGKQLVESINRLAEVGSIKNILLDRHIAAFILRHVEGIERDYNKLLSSKNDTTRFNGYTAEIFSYLQKKYNVASMVGLSNKLVDSMITAVKGLKNKKAREGVSNILEKLKATGDLDKIVKTVDINKITTEDNRKFLAAKNAAARLEREKSKLSVKVTPADMSAKQMGYGASRNFAFVCLVLTMVLTYI
ncbi:hypothetical protein QGN29_01915 [Temperatibacter marinus]|uniref:Protein kinase domain-containing protein n=1 Tax=Temperatibacter marinus TaxID=1456591 RepID=A0AA52EE50_9PROT|nr:hypothetical protein [Temperatibacter marinus]WND03121.1 hypothetical protein QGN29_01915 [Temperatibacter marinus]